MKKIFSQLLLLCAVMSINPAFAQTVVFEETFAKCDDKGGYDDNFQASVANSLTASTIDNYTDNPGWTVGESPSVVYEAYKCLKLAGSSTSKIGEVTTPELNVVGDATITIEAASWVKKDAVLTLSIVGDGSLDVTSFQLNSNKMEPYTAQLTGVTSTTKIKFSAAGNKMCYLGKIIVTQGGEVQATCATPVITAEQTTFSESTTATIATTTSGATIYYTSSDETEYPGNGTWVQYENELSITESQVLKAIAVCDGMQNSKITELQFTKVDKVSSTYLYRKVTSNKDIVNGGVYLIVAENAKKALSLYNLSKYLVESVTINDPYCESLAGMNTTDSPYEVTFLQQTGSSGEYALRTNSKYIGAGTSSTDLANKKNKEESNWTISSEDIEGTFIIKNGERCIAYSSSGDYFKNYKISEVQTGEYEAPALYRRIESTEGTFSIRTNEGYGTFYSEKPFIVPDGVKAGVVPGVDDAGVLSVDYKYDAGSTVPAGTALIVKNEAEAPGSFNFYYTDCDDAAPENKLYGKNGVNAEGMTEVAGADKYYTLNYGDNGLGFYYAEADGAATAYRDGCAFLALSSSESAKAISFIFNGGVTGIEQTVVEECGDVPTYTLSGVPVSTDTELPKGIYVRNGKKFIVK